MTKWTLKRFPDGYFRRVIYSLGPYIARRTSITSMHHAQLVCQVPIRILCVFFSLNYVCRCMACNKDLDKDALYRCEEHTNLLIESVEWGVLWNEYGIIGDLVVTLSFNTTT